MNFEDNAKTMGLIDDGEGGFFYKDRFGYVVYKQLTTIGSADMMGNSNEFGEMIYNDLTPEGKTDHLNNVKVPKLGIFLRQSDNDQYSYAGTVSDRYQFVGNEKVVSNIQKSIEDIGSPIFRESVAFSTLRTQMRHETIVEQVNNFPEIGDVYPLIIVNNSYNGSKSVSVSFGLFISSEKDTINNIRFGFQEKLGVMRQIHLVNSRTTMKSIVGDYLSDFSTGIIELINSNFKLNITNTDLLRTLDLIEKIGKKKRKEIEKFLSDIQDDESGGTTSWKLFLAITRFSSMEKNLNIKLLLENIAERVLVVPTAMLKTVRELQTVE